MSIPDFFYKIKGFRAIDKMDLLYVFVILGVAVSSFGLGRLSVGNKAQADDSIIITKSPVPNEKAGQGTGQTRPRIASQDMPRAPTGQKNFVASKNGKLYYRKGCKAANRIKSENEVWFSSESDAEKSGYKPSSSCK
ncbi:MAG: hypothetical protein V4665_00205 [Patescibacteria group bacterium]